MAGRDLYEVLGVSKDADISEIKQAYRKLAFELHPDTGENPDPDRFREVHEAYEILSNPERRRQYDAERSSTARARLSRAPHPGARRSWLIRDVSELEPSIYDLSYWSATGFFRAARLGRRSPRRANVSVILDPFEARFGCKVPIDVPVETICPRCDGSGGWWTICPSCHGWGLVHRIERVVISIPAGAVHGERYVLDLTQAGLQGVRIDITVLVQ